MNIKTEIIPVCQCGNEIFAYTGIIYLSFIPDDIIQKYGLDINDENSYYLPDNTSYKYIQRKLKNCINDIKKSK